MEQAPSERELLPPLVAGSPVFLSRSLPPHSRASARHLESAPRLPKWADATAATPMPASFAVAEAAW